MPFPPLFFVVRAASGDCMLCGCVDFARGVGKIF